MPRSQYSRWNMKKLGWLNTTHHLSNVMNRWGHFILYSSALVMTNILEYNNMWIVCASFLKPPRCLHVVGVLWLRPSRQGKGRGTAPPGIRSQEDGWQHVGDDSRLLQRLGSFCLPFLSLSLFLSFQFPCLTWTTIWSPGVCTHCCWRWRASSSPTRVARNESGGRQGSRCFVCPNTY